MLHTQNIATQFEEVRLITKSTFYYYKYDKHQQYYFIYQEISKRQGSFAVWLQVDFWKFWLDTEISNRNIQNFHTMDDFYFNTLLSLASTMTDLNIDRKFVERCVVEKISTDFLNVYKNLFIYFRNHQEVSY